MTVTERALDEQLKYFLRHDMKVVDGMINPPAAWLAAILCSIQKDEGIVSDETSAYLEIGVYKGLFCRLADYASRPFSFPIVGVDPFVLAGQDIDTVTAGLGANGARLTRIKLVKAYSHEFDKFRDALAGRSVDMIHVDGSHKYDGVLADLKFADKLVSEQGIVIADDFPKQWQLEVLEAVIVYLRDPETKLVPFAVGGTKLFLCHPAMAKMYQDRIIAYSRGNRDAGSCDQLINHIEKHERWKSFQPLRGHDVLMF